jgi:WD40 repeat protein
MAVRAIPSDVYPGPRPFNSAEAEIFFGRKREIEEVQALLLSYQVVLLYAPSGAGKTSLIQAGVLPGLTPSATTCRVGGDLPRGVAAETVNNVFAFNALCTGAPQTAPSEVLGSTTLAEVLSPSDDTVEHFIIFDQFEELFTTHTDRWEEREPFFVQLQALLERNRSLHVLLAIRQEHVAELDAYADLLPTSLRIRYNLEKLRPSAARDAIVEPALLAGLHPIDEIADAIVESLRQIEIPLPRQQGSTRIKTEFIEPVQLQVLCRRLSQVVVSGKTAELTALVNADQALAEFYDDAVAAAVQDSDFDAGVLRGWVEEQFITAAGTRGLAYFDEDAGTVVGVPISVVARLEQQHILTREVRGRSTWFELAHDRLIGPVRASNRDFAISPAVPPVKQADNVLSAQLGALIRDVNTLKRKADSREVAAAAVTNLDVDPERSLLLALHGCRIAEDAGEYPTQEATEALYRSLLGSHVRGVLRDRHVGRIWRIAEDLNGSRIISGGDDNYALVWNPATGDSVKLEPHNGAVLAVAFAGSKAAVTVDVSGAVRVWHLHTLAIETQWTVVLPAMPNVAINTAGTRVAVTGESSGVAVFDAGAGARVMAVANHANSPKIALNGDGTIIAVGDATGIELWDVTNSKSIRRLSGNDLGVLSMAFSPSGRRLCAVGQDGFGRVWDLEGNESGWKLGSGVWWLTAAAFSRDEKRVVIGDTRGQARIWDIETGKHLGTFRGHTDTLTSVSWSGDANHIVTASLDRTVRVWSVSEPDPLVFWTHRDSIQGVAFAPGGEFIATASTDRTAAVWDVISGSRVRELVRHTGSVSQVAISPDGAYIGTAGNDSRLIVWAMESGEIVRHFRGAVGERMLALCFSPTADIIAGCGSKGLAYAWDARSGSLVQTFKGHRAWVNGIAFSPDGSSIATSSDDRTVRVWDFTTGDEVRRWSGADNFQGVAFTPDGSRVVAGSHGGTATVWLVADGRETLVLRGHEKLVHSVRCDAAGQWLATASADNTAAVWDLSSGTRVAHLIGHTDEVWDVAFDPQGRYLATASVDRTVRVWSILAERETLVLNRPAESTIIYHPSRRGWWYARKLSEMEDIARSRLTRGFFRWEAAKYLHLRDGDPIPDPRGELRA